MNFHARLSRPLILTLTLAACGWVTAPASDLMRLHWSAEEDGTGGLSDAVCDLAFDDAGNVYVTGSSDGISGFPDYYTIKYSADGKQLWDARFSRSGGDTVLALDVDPAGGMVAVAGYSFNDDPEGLEMGTVLYDGDGVELWKKFFDSPGMGNAIAYDVALDSGGNVVVTGVAFREPSQYDYATVKYSPAGEQLWISYYDGPPGYYDQAYALVIDEEDKIYVTGRSAGGSGSTMDFCTICYGPDGEELWVAKYNGPPGNIDVGYRVALHPDGRVVVAGTSIGAGDSGEDFVLILYDDEGNESWFRRYDSGRGDDYCWGLAVTREGMMVAAGSSPSVDGDDLDLLVIQGYPDNSALTALSYDGPAGQDDQALAVCADGRGGILVAGMHTTNQAGGGQKLLLLKYDSWGNLLWLEDYDSAGGGLDEARAVAAGPGGRVAAAGVAPGNGGDFLTTVYEPRPCLLATAPGPGPDNPTMVRCFLPEALDTPFAELTAYGVDHYGVNVALGDPDGDGDPELLTGPGPGAVFGPQVRGFELTTAPMAGGAVNFFAYGTPRYGVNVSAGDLDGDGRGEILTGAGPGAVFGPHVRAFTFDGTAVSPVPEISFFAYGTPRYGVNVSAGDLDGDGREEILTGAGPGAVFGPHVRAFAYDGAGVSPVPGVSFFAYGTPRYGVNVSAGDLDGDGREEIITGAGPGTMFGPHVRAFAYDGAGVSPVPGISFFAYDATIYGVRVSTADLDEDGLAELLTVPGPGAENSCLIRGFDLVGGVIVPIPELDFYAFLPSEADYGGNVSGGAPCP